MPATTEATNEQFEKQIEAVTYLSRCERCPHTDHYVAAPRLDWQPYCRVCHGQMSFPFPRLGK